MYQIITLHTLNVHNVCVNSISVELGDVRYLSIWPALCDCAMKLLPVAVIVILTTLLRIILHYYTITIINLLT